MVKRFLAKKLKKTLFFNLFAGVASLLILLFPFFAQASFISSLLDPSAGSATQSPTFNSQTVPVLSAAANIDPNAPTGGGDITVVDGSALAAQAGPEGAGGDIIEQPTSSQISVYTVRDGDTLSGIAQMFGVSVGTILGANNIVGDTIHPGDTLLILPITGIEHTIVAGDTLQSLATKYGSNAEDIAQYNDLADNASLAVGSTILIPGGELAQTNTTSTNISGSSTSGSSSSSGKRIVIRGKVINEPYLGGSGPAIASYFGWPLAGNTTSCSWPGVVTQGLHGWNAVDIGAPTGTDIYAAAAGTVIVANDDGGWNGGYGNYVVISHPNGTETLYAHMSRVLTSTGSSVSQGDLIGKVGQTGEATGPHVHFEVRGAQNPFASLPLDSSDPVCGA